MARPERARAYLEALYAASLEPPMLAVARDGRVLAGWGDLTGAGVDRFDGGADVAAVAPWLHGVDLTAAAVLPDVEIGHGRVVDLHVVPDGERTLVMLVPADDAHAARRAAQQTANEVRLLNRRQRRLLADLEAANHAAERANAVQSRFIAGMSHEFRTPLASVLGYTDLILDHPQDEQETTAYAAAIGRAARHLLSMVDNVLDQARLEEGGLVLHMAPVDVRRVTDDLAAIVAPLAADKLLGFGAYVATAVPDFVTTDVVRLRQILLNIVGNAIKFTTHGEVGLEIDWRDGVLTATVTDTGPGIAEEERERIFEAFRRGAQSSGTRGAGLGLNITRRLLELLGGDISLESELGRGSRFTLHIPAPRADYAEPVRASAEASDVAGDPSFTRVLLAEDDVDIVDLMQIILGRAGHELTLAADGNEAVERAMTERPDIILMDVNMPGLDGLSAARILRDRGFAAPIVALTASLSVRDRGKALDAGCDGYLVKPIAATELLAAIERYTEAR